ncbi:hypothetical protein [Roseateles sp.]|uniref:hypothetical protein n=1 Tax=Roseateles sp. TaxID=1971397 RepID=UPI0031DBF6CF
MSNFKPYVLMSIIPSGRTNTWNEGGELLRALVNADARLMPEKVGNHEPLNIPVHSVEDCEPYWAVRDRPKGTILENNAANFLWKRARSIKSTGYVKHRHCNIHGEERPGWIIFKSDVDKKINWYEIFRYLCLAFEPVYATLHIVAIIEQNSSAYTEEEKSSFGFNDHVMGLPYVALKGRGLANISWANYFGPDLKGEVRQPEIRDAKFLVEEIGDGVMLRVTDNLLDVADDFDEFSRRRNKLRTFFREGTFRVNREPRLINSERSDQR